MDIPEIPSIAGAFYRIHKPGYLPQAGERFTTRDLFGPGIGARWATCTRANVVTTESGVEHAFVYYALDDSPFEEGPISEPRRCLYDGERWLGVEIIDPKRERV